MRLDQLLEKQLERRFAKDNRIILFMTRCKMLIHIQDAEWQENCSGILVLYQKRYSHGLTIVSTGNLDINFDFELYSNFPNYTKYIRNLCQFIFLAPSQNHCLRIMLVFQNKPEITEFNKQIERIYNSDNRSTEVDFFDQPQVQEVLKKVPIDENLLVVDQTFRKGVEERVKEYFARTTNQKESKKQTGFKYYALGREEWKIDLEETNYLKNKLESQILEQLTHLQKQARIRTSNK